MPKSLEINPHARQKNDEIAAALGIITQALLARIAAWVDFCGGDADFPAPFVREDDDDILAAYRCPEDNELRFRFFDGDASADSLSTDTLLEICKHLDLRPDPNA